MAVRYRWDAFVLDLDTYRVERDGVPVALEPKAFNLLALMVSRPDHVFTKQEIFDAVWPSTAVSDHALTRVVAQVRKALGDEAREARYLETVPTRGYRWIRPVQVDDGVAASSAPAVPATMRPTGDRPSRTRDRLPRRRRLAFALVGLSCAAAVLAVVWPRLPGQVAEADRVGLDLLRSQFPVQVTTHTGADMHPALSPAGDAIAYASDRAGSFEIHVRAFGSGGTDVALTSDGGQNVQPAWSPDAASIAYHSAVHGGVWVMPARGGTPRQVVTRGSNPRWSPDGRRIVYQSDEHADIAPTGFTAQVGSTLWIVDAGGGRPDPLTTPGHPRGGHGTPAWSRDGRYVAFSVFDGGSDNGAWVVRVDTRDVVAIERDVPVFELAFGDNDRSLYIAGGEPVIFRLPFDPRSGRRSGSRETIVVPAVPGVRGLSISADGRRLAFAGLSLASHIWALAIGPTGESGEPFALTRDTSRRNYWPSISPDGTKVAYVSARRGEAPNIWMMDVDLRRPLQLTDDAGFERTPSWLPDSRRVAYVRETEAESAIRTVDIATRRDERLMRTDVLPPSPPGAAEIGGRIAELQLSPSADRMVLAVGVDPLGYRRLYVTRRAPFAPIAITDGLRSTGFPVWSPDEQRLAVQLQDGGTTHLGVIDVATGSLRQITNERGQVWARSWSPDGRRVAASVLRRRSWSIEWFDVATGVHGVFVPPAPPNVYLRYPEWSPRNDLVVYERGELFGNIWTMAIRPPD